MKGVFARCVLLAALAAPATGSSSPVDGVIVATAYHGGRSSSDIVLLDEGGTIVSNLTPGDTVQARDEYAAWSPDGSKLVFLSHRDGPRFEEIYVMNVDGSGQRRLTTDSGDGRLFNTGPAWSPDGARIAFLKTTPERYEIWVMNADGSGQRALTADGGYKSAPRWAPDGTLLLYGRGTEIRAVDLAGRQRTLTPSGAADMAPAWSSDGRRIAFVSRGMVHVVNADGTGRRALTRPHQENSPLWSPDGTRILFTSTRSRSATRYSTTYVRNAYVVGVDTLGERRLTGPPEDDFTERFAGAADSWWPDGSRAFIRANGFSPRPALWVMNADGSCERPWGPATVVLAAPQWRPTERPASPPAQCTDLGVVARTNRASVGIRDPIDVEVTIWNDGNEVARGVRLRGTVAVGALEIGPDSGCRSGTQTDCSVEELAPQTFTKVIVTLRPRAATSGRLALTVAHLGPDSNPVNDSTEVYAFVLDCTHVGSDESDQIEGTAGADRICALPGADSIRARAGNDSIHAGSGADSIEAGRGRDAVFAADGDDVVEVRDGERDRVDCGSGSDVVLADRLDVLRRCESVRRRR